MTIDLAPEVEERVHRAAADSHVTASFLVLEAVQRFLEDREDYAAGIRALSSMKYSVSLAEMERRSDVAG